MPTPACAERPRGEPACAFAEPHDREVAGAARRSRRPARPHRAAQPLRRRRRRRRPARRRSARREARPLERRAIARGRQARRRDCRRRTAPAARSRPFRRHRAGDAPALRNNVRRNAASRSSNLKRSRKMRVSLNERLAAKVLNDWMKRCVIGAVEKLLDRPRSALDARLQRAVVPFLPEAEAPTCRRETARRRSRTERPRCGHLDAQCAITVLVVPKSMPTVGPVLDAVTTGLGMRMIGVWRATARTRVPQRHAGVNAVDRPTAEPRTPANPRSSKYRARLRRRSNSARKPFTLRPSASISVPIESGAGIAATKRPKPSAGSAQSSTAIDAPCPAATRSSPGRGGCAELSANSR